MIAQLPMYLRPENLQAHQLLWSLIRDQLRLSGIDAPGSLDTREYHEDVWSREDLVLSQVCNLPLRGTHKNKLTLIGACDYGLQSCPPGFYRSLFVVRKEKLPASPFDFDGTSLAFNDTNSHSGYAAPLLWAQQHGMRFIPALACDSHENAVIAVAGNEADIACIDAQSWRDIQRFVPESCALAVIGATENSPDQTFCTRLGENASIYFEALSTAIAALPEKPRQLLGLRGIVSLDDSAYDLPLPPGYSRLSC